MKKFNVVNLFSSVKNLVKQQPTDDKEDNYDGITVWGVDRSVENDRGRYSFFNSNDFPQQIIQDVYNSPVASSCLEVWTEFLAGSGFVNPNLGEEVINEQGETVNQLKNKVSQDLALLDGLSIHTTYKLSGEKKALHHQPFEQTRLGIIKNSIVTDIKTNPYFGIPQDYQNKYTKSFYTYHPDPQFVQAEVQNHNELLSEQKIKHQYPGQMYWASIERPLSRIYPQPFYYSGINWFKIDAEIQQFHERNIKNNLLLGNIVNIHGDPDAPAYKDDDNGDQGLTVGEVFDAQMKGAQGSLNAGGSWINWFQNPDEKTEVVNFPTNANDKLFETLQSLTTSQISISCKTPPILIGIQEAGKLGNTNDVLNAVKMMQSTVKRKQQFLSEHLYAVCKDFLPYNREDFEIKNINLIDLLPEWAIKDPGILDRDEKRDYLSSSYGVELKKNEPQV